MRIGKLYDACKYLVIGMLCVVIASFLIASLQDVSVEHQIDDSLEALPNYNYVHDIEALKAENKFSEALEMARFVVRHTDMPGQVEAKQLEKELESELGSMWGDVKRATSGFLKGSGNSIEELTGGIASDMIIYGDIRDLVKQGYYRITGNETDPVIVALAGLGLITEAVDMVDWAPAVLKAFRKIGALSQKFTDFLLTAVKKSVKELKLDDALKTALANLRHLTDKMGLARTAAVFKYVDEPDDLAALTAVAQKNVDAAYFTVKNGGADGVGIIKRLGDSDVAVTSLEKAAKKGPAGIQWLKRDVAGHKHVAGARFGARLLKNLHLQRPQQLITEIVKMYPGIMKALWAVIVLALLGAVYAFVASGRLLYGLRNGRSTLNKTAENA